MDQWNNDALLSSQPYIWQPRLLTVELVLCQFPPNFFTYILEYGVQASQSRLLQITSDNLLCHDQIQSCHLNIVLSENSYSKLKTTDQ